jgi:serine/threonine protein phosphatase PrpC
MSIHSKLSRVHKNSIYLILSLLGSLLMSLQLVLPATVLAASPRATTDYTFGTSRPLDLASVAVVRLVIATSPTVPGGLSKPCFSGVGTIVSSSTVQQGTALNYVLTDGSLLTCGATPVALAITIYANNAYTNNASSAVTLAIINCASDLKKCTTNSSTQPASKTICTNDACNTGAVLLPFFTTAPQSYLTTTLTPAGSTFRITLGGPSAVVQPSTASNLSNLLPVVPGQQAIDTAATATPTASSSTQFFEVGTPLVDNAGDLVSIHTSTGESSFPSANIPPSTTNTLESSWQTDITNFYSRNYTAVSNSAASIEKLNPVFLAATGLKSVADTKLIPTPTTQPNNNNNNSTQNNNGFFGISTLVLAVAGLILLILVLGLVSLVVARHRRELARFEREQEAAGRTASLDAERIRMEETSRRISGPMAAQPGQVGHAGAPVQQGPSPFIAPIPSPGLQPVPVDLYCPNCNYPYTRGDTQCPNCHVLLSPSDSGHHVRMVQPPSAPPQPPHPPVPNIQSPVLMPASSMGEMPTQEFSPSQQSLAEETTVPFFRKAPIFNGHDVSILAGSRSDPGIKRKQKPNEDSLLAVMGERTHNSLPQQFGLFVVADGMGGHANGQDASRLAIQTMVDRILPKLSSSEELDDQALVQLLVNGVQQANIAVYERNMEHHADMGTTMTSAIVVGSMAYVANVGDSRTYMYREPEGLHKITHDHSVVASLVEAGIIRNEDIYTHPKRNQIYRSLGEKPDLEVDSFVEALQPGDKLLLCSDGLWEMVRDRDAQREQDIQRILSVPTSDPKQTANALIKAANNGGGEDNITAIVVSVTEATTRTGMTGIHVFDMPESVKLPQM